MQALRCPCYRYVLKIDWDFYFFRLLSLNAHSTATSAIFQYFYYGGFLAASILLSSVTLNSAVQWNIKSTLINCFFTF